MNDNDTRNVSLLKCNIKRWERHGNLVIISAETLQKLSLSEENLSDDVLDEICNLLKCDRIAVKYKISPDDYRTPQIRLLRGDDPWVLHIDNGIKYSFDITKCMFSSGNIKEKLRVSKLNCDGQIIIDMFAGIGYFTLPFLIHTNALRVHSCEWNPHAVEALQKNLQLNRVTDKCVIHFGDNRDVCPIGIADRVYLGLIPTSLVSLEIACRALQPKGGILHIHENVNSFNAKAKSEKKFIWCKWADDTAIKVKSIITKIHSDINWNIKVLETNKVKAYAPHIDHLVVDINCIPI